MSIALSETIRRRLRVHVSAKAADPTQTLFLREAFVRDVVARFDALQTAVIRAIIKDNVFGIGSEGEILTMASIPTPGKRAFDFPRRQDKVAAFMDWLRDAEQHNVLEVTALSQLGRPIEGAWTDRYVKSAYQRGMQRARQEMQIAGMDVSSIEKTGGLDAAFHTPFHADRVGVIYSRTFNELRGITDDMDGAITQVLAKGMAEGRNPKELAAQMIGVISGPPPVGDLSLTDTLGRFIPAKRRAVVLARTEVIRAHHVATIQEYRNWAVAGVTVQAEWRTAGDNRVCSICAELERKVFTLEEIEPMIPRHPQCRCISIPFDMTDVPVKEVDEPAEQFDVSGYPADPKEITLEQAMAQANWRDTQALMNADLREIQTGTLAFKSIREDVTYSSGKHRQTIISNMKAELDSYGNYLAGDTMSLSRDFIDDFSGVIGKIRPSSKLNASALNNMGRDSVRKLVMQEIESNRQQFTDHGIRHLVNNVKMQGKVLDQLVRGGINVSPEDRLRGMFIMVNHDVGYTTPLIRGGGFRGVAMSKLHPEFGAKIAEQQKSIWNIGKVFSETQYDDAIAGIATHADTTLDLSNPLMFATRTADNTLLYAPAKLPSMFRYVENGEELLIKLGYAAKWNNEVLINQMKDELRQAIDGTARFSSQLKRDLKAGVDQLNPMSPKFTMGVLGGDVTDVYSSAKSLVVMDVEASKWDGFLMQHFDMGQSQLKKLMKDYGASFADNVLTLGEHEGKNILEIRLLKSPLPRVSPDVLESGVLSFTNSAELRALAEEMDMPLAVLVEKIEERFGEQLQRMSVWTRVQSSSLNKIIGDGRMKTQFEIVSSGGAYDPELRNWMEERVVGVSEVAPRNRPVYGYLTSQEDGEFSNSALRQYGSMAIKLKPKTRSFTTFTAGDSLDSNVALAGSRRIENLNIHASPVDAPKWYSAFPHHASRLYEGKPIADVVSFMEAQVHGGVTLEDIEEIVFMRQSLATAALTRRLDKLGIKWRVRAVSFPSLSRRVAGEASVATHQQDIDDYYDPRQARDKRRRWTSEGRGSGGGGASPGGIGEEDNVSRSFKSADDRQKYLGYKRESSAWLEGHKDVMDVDVLQLRRQRDSAMQQRNFDKVLQLNGEITKVELSRAALLSSHLDDVAGEAADSVRAWQGGTSSMSATKLKETALNVEQLAPPVRVVSWGKNPTSDNMRNSYLRVRALNQAYMERRGISSVSLYRGLGDGGGKEILGQAKHLKGGAKLNLTEAPLVGYTSNRQIAWRYSRNGVAVIRRVPRSEIVVHKDLFSGMTQSWTSEEEFIVLGGTKRYSLRGHFLRDTAA